MDHSADTQTHTVGGNTPVGGVTQVLLHVVGSVFQLLYGSGV